MTKIPFSEFLRIKQKYSPAFSETVQKGDIEICEKKSITFPVLIP